MYSVIFKPTHKHFPPITLVKIESLQKQTMTTFFAIVRLGLVNCLGQSSTPLRETKQNYFTFSYSIVMSAAINSLILIYRCLNMAKCKMLSSESIKDTHNLQVVFSGPVHTDLNTERP